MNIKKEIQNMGITPYRFAKNKNISSQNLHYWMSKPWDQLNFKTKVKIKDIFKNIN